MFAIAELHKIRTIVSHQNSPDSPCPDGVASALILRDALPQAEVVFRSYGQMGTTEFAPKHPVLFCDITPPEERVGEFKSAGALVLDHHVQQKATVEAFGERGIYSDERGVSGALLAYRHVWCAMRLGVQGGHIRSFAGLAGIRDTWRKDSSDWIASCEQAEALRFWPWEDWPRSFDDPRFMMMLSIGSTLYKKGQESAQHAANEAYYSRTPERGTKLAIVGTTHTSDIAEKVEADILVGFRYFAKDGEHIQMVLSFRARGDYDVGALAKSLKGGGHRSAAGAVISIPASIIGIFANDPYTFIRELIRNYEAGRSPEGLRVK